MRRAVALVGLLGIVAAGISLSVMPTSHTAAAANELAFVRIRYKAPGADTSQLIESPVPTRAASSMAEADADFRFAAAVAGFSQVLRGGRHTGRWSIADARALAASGVGGDRFGYRAEALRLMDLAGSLQASATLQPMATSAPVDDDRPGRMQRREPARQKAGAGSGSAGSGA